MNDDNNPQNIFINDGLTVLKSWFLPNAGAQFDEVGILPDKVFGTRVTQLNRTYIAKNWELTEGVKHILSKAAILGFSKFWRHGHPKDSYFFGSHEYNLSQSDKPKGPKAIHHIGCSKSHYDPWVFVLGGECRSSKRGVQKLKSITFNKNFEYLVAEALNENIDYQKPIDDPFNILGRYEIEKGAGENIITHPEDFNVIIECIAKKL